AGIEPAEFLAKPDDLSDNSDCRSLESLFACFFSYVGQFTFENLLLGPCPPVDKGNRGIWCSAVVHQGAGNLRQGLDPHVDDNGPAAEREPLPVDLRVILFLMFLPGDKSYGCSDIPVSQRYPGKCSRTYSGGYPRYYFVGYACRCQSFALFAAASENERISPLEPSNGLAFQRLFDEQRMALPLSAIVRSADLHGLDQLGM